MANQQTYVSVKMDVFFGLNETEVRALEALAGYGTDEFLTAFYEKMGKAYLEKHEDGIRTLFDKIKKDLRPRLDAMDELRKATKGIEGLKV